MHAIGIGDEVLLSTGDFGLNGRSMRNVRQAVQRTHNAGVLTEVVREGDLDEPERTRLRSLATEAMGGVEERGFSMNMDGMLTGRHAFPILVIARGTRTASRSASRDTCRARPDGACRSTRCAAPRARPTASTSG